MIKNRKGQRILIWLIFLIGQIFVTACAPNIEKLKSNKDVDALIGIIESNPEAWHDDRCFEAAEALGELGDERAVKPLINSFHDSTYSDYRISNKSYNDVVIEALILIGENGVDEIIEYLLASKDYSPILSDEKERSANIKKVLIGIGPDVVEPLFKTIEENPSFENYAMDIMMSFGTSLETVLVEKINNGEDSSSLRKALNELMGYHNVEKAAEAVCQGKLIPGALDYEPSNQNKQYLYIINTFHSQDYVIHNEWLDQLKSNRARNVENLQVVLCFREIWVELEKCVYGGFLIPLYRERIVVDGDMYAAKTGEKISSFSFSSADPGECPESIESCLGCGPEYLYEEIPFSTLSNWLLLFGIQID